MELLFDQALESLDHTAQKDKGELAHKGKLGKRKRPSRASLKAQLSTAALDGEGASQVASDEGSEDDVLNRHDQVNGELASSVQISYDDHPVIKQGPEGTVIEIGNARSPDAAATVIRINYPMEEESVHAGAVVRGAILKSPEKRLLSEMTGTVALHNGTKAEVDESEDEEAKCKRWKSLPSLWQIATKCKEEKREQPKGEEAPWAHEVKLRHVKDPESAHRGCSMLFFGPLPKSQQSPTTGRRDIGSSGNDSKFPDLPYNGTDVVYRPIRPRPSSVCDHVQIQTWDRRHLTSSSRTNANDALQKFCSATNLGADAPLVTETVSSEKPTTAAAKEERKAATYRRSKPKKRWKLDVMENGVQRSKSLNGIDKTDQPEWIELSRRLTSRNIDWENLPNVKSGNTGKNLESELRLAWKIKGTQEKAEVNSREDGKDEIVLSKEDLALIPNGFTRPLPRKENRWEKLDANANSSQHHKSTLSKVECPQRARALPQQPSAQEDTVLWIKEAEKRRQKYMDWQSQEMVKLVDETSNKKSPLVPKETAALPLSTLPEIAVNKTVPTKLMNNEQLGSQPIKEEFTPHSKKEDKIKDAFRQELSLFSVKLRRVRCAKPEECFHEVKCQPAPDKSQPTLPEPISEVIPMQPPIPCPRRKKPLKTDTEIIKKDTENKPSEDSPPPRDAFSVQVPEEESDDFFIVINDQDDDSFLQIKPPKDVKFDKSSSSATAALNAPTVDRLREDDARWSVKPADEHRTKTLTEASTDPLTTNENDEANVSLTNDLSSIDTNEAVVQSIGNQCNNRDDTVAIETSMNVHPDQTSGTGNFCEIESMFGNLNCEDQPDSMIHIDVNANESARNETETQSDNAVSVEDWTNSGEISRVDQIGVEDNEPLYGKIHKIPNGILPHQDGYLNLNGHRIGRKLETPEEKAARMTSEICGVLSSLGNRKSEAEKLALKMDILTTLTCPNAVCAKNASARAMTFVTCNGDRHTTHAQVNGPQSVGVQTNGIELHDTKPPEKSPKKSQTRIKKKTVKIIIHECDDDDDKQEVVEEIVEEILEPRTQKGRMVKAPPTISRTVAEAEDGSRYLTTTVVDNCVFRPEDAT